MYWLFRVAVVLAAAFVVVYFGDWAVYRLRGEPQSKVTVHRYVSIPEKGRKTEFDYQGTLDVACSVSLFAQGEMSPCWQLRRNPNQGLSM
jgi:sterol desaturase/sphingolipid hydroxylase (fatty acid hydroxylase superfamily)